jgi:hypothetical protein
LVSLSQELRNAQGNFPYDVGINAHEGSERYEAGGNRKPLDENNDFTLWCRKSN